MKKCSTCKQLKTLEEFVKNKSRGDGLHTECKQCKKNRKSNYYQLNKDKFRGYNEKRREKLKTLFRKLKDFPCLDCKKKYPYYVMHFHHREPSKKEFEIGRAVGSSMPIEKILKEINKCDLLCANCHAIRTFEASENR